MDETQPINIAFSLQSLFFLQHTPLQNHRATIVTALLPALFLELYANCLHTEQASNTFPFQVTKGSIMVTRPYSRDSTVTAL